MQHETEFHISELGSQDTKRFRMLLNLFGDVFDMRSIYHAHQPDDDYLQDLLGSSEFIAVIAETQDGHGPTVVGGLCAYILRKFEQQRSEIYIYDLAVHSSFRRQKIATRMINMLQDIAVKKNAYIIFVQADGDDDVARALYQSLGVEEHVYHYDIAPLPR